MAELAKRCLSRVTHRQSRSVQKPGTPFAAGCGILEGQRATVRHLFGVKGATFAEQTVSVAATLSSLGLAETWAAKTAEPGRVAADFVPAKTETSVARTLLMCSGSIRHVFDPL